MYTNILNIPKGFICHQVSLRGSLGTGLAYELGETLNWDPKKEEFKDNKQADKMRKRKNRKY